MAIKTINSNTTNVKVKPDDIKIVYLVDNYSNTTNVKVKPGKPLSKSLVYHIQIQPMLRLNFITSSSGSPSSVNSNTTNVKVKQY